MIQHQFNKKSRGYDVPFKNTIREFIRHAKHKSILDVGAGYFTEYYGFKHDNIDIKYTGVDMNNSLVEQARSFGIDAYCCRCETLPFNDRAFDCSICIDVINYNMDFRGTISELIRVSRKDVYIIFHKMFCDDDGFDTDNLEMYVNEDDETGVVYKQIKSDRCVDMCYFSRQKIEQYLKNIHNITYSMFTTDRPWLIDHQNEPRYLLHIHVIQ